LTAQANLQVQNGSPGAWNQSASEFLNRAHGMLPADGNSGSGYMFYATPEQKANAEMYAGYYPDGVGMNRPAAGDVANSVNREASYRDAYAKGTLASAAGAALIAGGPAVAVLPGVPIFSSGGALGSGAMASPMGTGVISAGINAGSQYIQNGSVNPVDVASAFGTGVAGSYGGLLWNVGVNVFGGATTAALNNVLNGTNNSIIGAGITSGAFSTIGYGAGAVTANSINSIMRPTINNAGSWASSGVWSGNGYNLFNPNNTAVIGGGFTGGTLQEIVQGAVNKAQQIGGKK
jgi:filamentous hemagglutinin